MRHIPLNTSLDRTSQEGVIFLSTVNTDLENWFFVLCAQASVLKYLVCSSLFPG